jgi:tetratricopeptide (TPR) repeat protein
MDPLCSSVMRTQQEIGMAYVRARGSQVLIVHGERDPVTRKVGQRILFTIYSKDEAKQALADLERGGGAFGSLLQDGHRGLRFDWRRLARDLRAHLHVLPDEYDAFEARVRSRFREALLVFARRLMQADPQELATSAALLRDERPALEFLKELIEWRVERCEQERDKWNEDTRFYWRFERASRAVPMDVEELAAGLWEKRDLDRAEAAFRLMVDSFEGYAEGHNYLGLIALERDRLDEAIDRFRRTADLGRRLFPRRIARGDYWRDLETRPYMRGLRNLALALNRAGRWEEALAVCDRLEEECGDRVTAMAHRSSTYLNTGRFPEAVGAAEYLRGLDPATASLVAALAHFETGRRRAALAAFLHGALNAPRAARLLLGRRLRAPRSADEARDHESGIDLGKDLAAYLRDRRRASLRFLTAVLARPEVVRLLDEIEAVVRRWDEQHRTGAREAFDRMRLMRDRAFAEQHAREICDALALPQEAPLPEVKRRRGAEARRRVVH